MHLRVRGPSGQSTLQDVDPSGSIASLLVRVEGVTGVPPERQEILAGYPPKPLDLSGPGNISSLGIHPGDMVTVRQSAVARSEGGQQSPTPTHHPSGTGNKAHGTGTTLEAMQAMDEDEALARAIAASLDADPVDLTRPESSPRPRSRSPPPAPLSSSARASTRSTMASGGGIAASATTATMADGSCVVRRVIDSDNSCLFNAVGYALEGGLRYKAPVLRQVCVEAVLADPGRWTEAVLEKPPGEYCAWLDDPRHWGGAIELSILSKQYKRQIAAFDIQTRRVDVYGSEEDYAERGLVLYDGLHYDALAVSPFPGAPEDLDVTCIPSTGARCEEIMGAAVALVAAAHDARQFTDTSSFTLRCGRCGEGLRGEKEALAHARATGHADFSEY